MALASPTMSDSINFTVAKTCDGNDAPDRLQVQVAMSCAYAVITVCGVLGNVITCTVIARSRVLYTATNYYLFNMAVSDLLLLVMGMPHEMQVLWCPRPYMLGEIFCVSRGLAAETSTNASVLTIAAFTVERYIGICHPIRSQTMNQLSRVIKIIALLWVVACAGAVPQAIQYGIEDNECKVVNAINLTFEVSMFLFFITPMTLITVLYVKIGLVLYRTQPPGMSARCLPAGDKSRNKGVIKMLVAVVVAFFVCFAPHHAQRLLAFYGDPTNSVQVTVYQFLTHISGIFYYVSTCINPILYHIMSNRFKQAFKDTVRQCLGRGNSKLVRQPSGGFAHSDDLSSKTQHTQRRLSLLHGTPERARTLHYTCTERTCSLRTATTERPGSLYRQSFDRTDTIRHAPSERDGARHYHAPSQRDGAQPHHTPSERDSAQNDHAPFERDGSFHQPNSLSYAEESEDAVRYGRGERIRDVICEESVRSTNLDEKSRSNDAPDDVIVEPTNSEQRSGEASDGGANSNDDYNVKHDRNTCYNNISIEPHTVK